jgi:hypothetical protein
MLSATRIATMMRRFAKPVDVSGARYSKIVNPQNPTSRAYSSDFNLFTGRPFEPGERP